jgi:hypothetical protein
MNKESSNFVFNKVFAMQIFAFGKMVTINGSIIKGSKKCPEVHRQCELGRTLMEYVNKS